MNARWFRDNLSVLISSLVFVLILTGIIWFLRQAAAEQGTVLQDLEGQQTELTRLRDNKIFPSQENIDVIKRDREQIKHLYASMQSVAIPEIIQPVELENPIDFSQLMRTTVNRLTETAGKKNVKVPDSFAWGFSRYIATFPCKNPAAKPDECKRLLRLLAKQLAIVEKFSLLLMDSKVENIGAIRRTEVEPGSSADGLNAPINDDKESLYHIYPFEVQFGGDTDALRSFLNALAQADNLYVVRSIHTETSLQKVNIPIAAPIRLATDPVDFDSKPVETSKAIETHRLNVIVRLDLIEFVPRQKPKTGKG